MVEHRLSEESLPYPKWLVTSARLTEQWFVDASSADDPAITAVTPPALLARGVVIDAAELESV